MEKRFRFVELTTSEPQSPQSRHSCIGYYHASHVTLAEVRASSKLPEDIKVNPYIYELRMSDDGSHKATIEPTVRVNFAGTFITNEDLFEDWQGDDKFLNLVRMRVYPGDIRDNSNK